MSVHLQARDKAPDFEVEDIYGHPVSLHAQRGYLVLLSFYRHTIGPPCDFHFRVNKITHHYPGGRFKFIAVFEAEPKYLRGHIQEQCRLPFFIVADPKAELFKLYRVDLSKWQAFSAMLHSSTLINTATPNLGASSHSHIFGRQANKCPADFLIMADGKIEIVHYGRHPADHLSFTAIERCLSGATHK